MQRTCDEEDSVESISEIRGIMYSNCHLSWLVALIIFLNCLLAFCRPFGATTDSMALVHLVCVSFCVSQGCAESDDDLILTVVVNVNFLRSRS